MSTETDINAKLDLVLQELSALRQQIAPAPEYGGMELAKEVLGLEPFTIRRKCRDGELPHTREGRQYRFRRSELQQHQAKHHQPTAATMAHAARHHQRNSPVSK
jgi:excisionase family DNA binding protein